MRLSRFSLVLLPLLVLTTSGCLVAADSKQERVGNYVADTTFAQIEPGQTSEKWVVATIGEPDVKTDLGGGESIWKWSYTEVKKSSGAVFLVFAGSDKKEATRHAYVQFKDGVVTKKWRG